MLVINRKLVTELTKVVSLMLIPLMGVWSNSLNHGVNDLSFLSSAGTDSMKISNFSYYPPDRGGPKTTQGTGTRI